MKKLLSFLSLLAIIIAVQTPQQTASATLGTWVYGGYAGKINEVDYHRFNCLKTGSECTPGRSIILKESTLSEYAKGLIE